MPEGWGMHSRSIIASEARGQRPIILGTPQPQGYQNALKDLTITLRISLEVLSAAASIGPQLVVVVVVVVVG
jgi:hypothetical protein